MARAHDSDAAIALLDRHPFTFPLDEAALAWFRAAEVAPPVLDYLSKRARVDWEALRGDVDPDTPVSRPQGVPEEGSGPAGRTRG